MLTFVAHGGMMRRLAVRVTPGCGRPSAVQTKWRQTMPCARKSAISLRQWNVFRSEPACAASPRAAGALDDATQNTSGAPLRLGTAGEVKKSASLDVASVSPRGSVVTVCEFDNTEHCMGTRIVASSGFGSVLG